MLPGTSLEGIARSIASTHVIFHNEFKGTIHKYWNVTDLIRFDLTDFLKRLDLTKEF